MLQIPTRVPNEDWEHTFPVIRSFINVGLPLGDQHLALSPVGWEGKSIDLSGFYFRKLARISNEDPTYPNIFLDMVFLAVQVI